MTLNLRAPEKQATDDTRPVWWLVLADSGNIIFHGRDGARALRCAEKYGRPVKPLYARPQSETETALKASVMLEALKRIATGEGHYGAQAAEYKQIARDAIAKVTA